VSVYVIAEAGVNHNGDRDMAFKLVDAAAHAGADAVKFQTFKAEHLVTMKAAKAPYQQLTTDTEETQFNMLRRLELDHGIHHELLAYCNEIGIEFLSTAFDQYSLKFLANDLGLEKLKIPSGEITNGPLLLDYSETGCELIVSTGMATLGEIEEALGVIAFGFLQRDGQTKEPSRIAFREAFCSKNGQQQLKNKVTLLHCTTEYPAPPGDINLRAMVTLRNVFGLNVGYSDHSEGDTVASAAAALGATIIEKHFTLDRSLPGPDHKASLEPDGLKIMVETIRTVEHIMGDGVKAPRPTEFDNRAVIRKSIVAACDIATGELFTKSNIAIMRPASGKNPMDYWDLLDCRSPRDYLAGEVIS